MYKVETDNFEGFKNLLISLEIIMRIRRIESESFEVRVHERIKKIAGAILCTIEKQIGAVPDNE